jgi:hypothetical protein
MQAQRYPRHHPHCCRQFIARISSTCAAAVAVAVVAVAVVAAAVAVAAMREAVVAAPRSTAGDLAAAAT